MTSQARNDIIGKLIQKTMSLTDWTEILSDIKLNQLESIVPLLVTNISSQEMYYVEFLRTLLFYDEDEDRVTEVLDHLFTSLPENFFLNDWFIDLSKDFLSWTTSEILVENYFLFLSQEQKKKSLSYETKFFRTLEQIQTLLVKFNLMVFLLEQNIHLYENKEILRLFYNVPTELKLRFIPILFTLPKDKQLTLSKELLFSKEQQQDQYIILSILFRIQQNLPAVFTTYEEFKNFLGLLKEEQTYELLYNELVKPDSIVNEWIGNILLDEVKQGTNRAKILIEASGEYIAEWPERYREIFLQLIVGSNSNLQTSLAKILSPLWYDEQIILQLLEKTDEKVREALYESIVTIFAYLRKELQQKFLNLFKSEEQNKRYLGLLMGYNVARKEFTTEVTRALEQSKQTKEEEILSGVLLGLGLQWNKLDKEIKEKLKGLTKNLSNKARRELLKGLEMIYGSLDLDGINFVTNLQSYEYQIAPEDVKLD